ncbi:hypothetical protein [Mucilaginibacter sp.]|uniref:hypothetical protein n=1 Tax=Mucilaginibacter sp. TaxID=1882438 RepID=UPI0025E467B4|nr:hypothetical protein [Mucilaginibacter sp.]
MQRLFLLLVIVIAVSACKKGSSGKTTYGSATELVKQQITHYDLIHADTDLYTYDAGNHLTTHAMMYHGVAINADVYKYDGADEPSEVDNYDVTTGKLRTKYSFAYSAGKAIVTEHNGDGLLTFLDTLRLNSKNQVARLYRGAFYNAFTYDVRGNVSSVQGFKIADDSPATVVGGPAIYDEGKNPFSAVKPNYYFSYLLYVGSYNTYVNNLSGGFVYQFDGNGYPTKESIVGQPNFYVLYSYVTL